MLWGRNQTGRSLACCLQRAFLFPSQGPNSALLGQRLWMAVGEHMAFLEGQGPPLRPADEGAGQAVLSLQGSVPKAEGIYVLCVCILFQAAV